MAGFRKATKKAKNLVISFQGASGAGKTYSALNVAKHLCPVGKRIAFIDTENSADLYGDLFDFDVDNDFGPFGKLNYGPAEWMKKLQAAAATKEYGVVVLDSLTHMWKGAGGILAQLDEDAALYKTKTGRFADTNALWKKFDPMYTKFMNDLRHLPFHVIFCLRAKQKTDRKTNEKGKIEITKLGFEAEFRDGFDYDVDAQFLLDEDHVMVAKKHRLGEFLNNKAFTNPGRNLAEVLTEWLVNGVAEGEEPDVQDAPAEAPAPAPKPIVKVPAPAVTSEDVTKAIKAVEKEEQSPPTEPHIKPSETMSVADSLIVEINACRDLSELKTVADKIKVAKNDKLITDVERNGPITAAYSAKQKSLKVAA